MRVRNKMVGSNKTWLLIQVVLITGLFSNPILIHAQWNLKYETKWPNVDRAIQDSQGNFYLVTLDGTISKFDKSGNSLVEYSPSTQARVYQLDALSQLKITAFYQDLQEYIVLDRYLTSPSRYSIADFGLGFVSDIAFNFQQNIWVVDMSDFMLKLIDPRNSRVLEKKSLAKVLNQESADVVSLIAHQNRMYLLDKTQGVLVFDAIGNYLESLNFESPKTIRFYKDMVYYVQGDSLILRNLYTSSSSSLPLPEKSFVHALYSDERLVLIGENGFMIYQYLSGNFSNSK